MSLCLDSLQFFFQLGLASRLFVEISCPNANDVFCMIITNKLTDVPVGTSPPPKSIPDIRFIRHGRAEMEKILCKFFLSEEN